MQPQVLELPELTIHGLSKTFRNRDHSAIKQLWETLERGFATCVETCNSRYGVNKVTDGTIGEFSYTAGVPVAAEEVPAGLQEVDIPAGRYAVARANVGPGADFETPEDAVAWVWAEWLPTSDWEGLDELEFIRFDSSFDFTSKVGEVTLAIPVAKRGTRLASDFGF